MPISVKVSAFITAFATHIFMIHETSPAPDRQIDLVIHARYLAQTTMLFPSPSTSRIS